MVGMVVLGHLLVPNLTFLLTGLAEDKHDLSVTVKGPGFFCFRAEAPWKRRCYGVKNHPGAIFQRRVCLPSYYLIHFSNSLAASVLMVRSIKSLGWPL